MRRRAFLAALATAPWAPAQELHSARPPKANARISYGKDPSQFGDLYLPHGPRPYPVVLTIHGGFWQSSSNLHSLAPLCLALAHAGAAVWNLEYRRIGDPGGDWAGIADDIVRGAEELLALQARYTLDLSHLTAAGFSAGGQLALWLAAQRVVDLRGVTGLAAISDLRRAWALQLDGGVVRQLLGGTPDQIPQRYAAASPEQLLPISVPQRLVHGTADNVVPFDMSRRFAKASGNSQLVPIPGAGHFDLIDPASRFWPAVQKAILDWQF
ncbi:MAG TPA: prolyl oligopeptidase family serine peptidase [Bryobacteraceae bacterium]|nr:prolyl oligopeptidase family serine peptidase [Bryobacteraceae bacterium]